MNSNKIKIGILSKEISNLRSFEYRIFDEIFKNQNLEIVILIFDGRKKAELSFIKKITSLFIKKNFISRIILKIQEFIEKNIFKDNSYYPDIDLINKIKLLNQIDLYPKKKGFLDIFSKQDCEKIKEFNVDLIIRTEFNIISGEILNSFKYGIWSFHHGDNRVNRGGPPCFWELIEKHENIGVTLQKLTPKLDGGKIIDRGSYNPHWSWIKTKRKVYDSSISLLMKNLNLLHSNSLELKDSPQYFNKIYKFPSTKYSLIYISRFYSKLFIKIVRKISFYIYSTNYEHWSLSFSDQDLFNLQINAAKIFKTPKNEFWADPFLFERNNRKFIFFENYDYKTKLGKISCGELINNKLANINDVLVKDYHLSYPFIYEDDGNIFMIPETSGNNRLEIYQCIEFPRKWSLSSTAFYGEKIIDCNIYKDDQNKIWLFLNKKKFESDGCSDLYVYLIDSLNFNKIIPHKFNPVLTDSSRARNAGPIFSYENKIFRPSQINNKGVYGRGININEIVELSIDKYEERIHKTYLPDFNKEFIGLHHIHYNKSLSVFDLCKTKK